MNDLAPELIELLQRVRRKEEWARIARCGHWIRRAKSDGMLSTDEQGKLVITGKGTSVLCGRREQDDAK